MLPYSTLCSPVGVRITVGAIALNWAAIGSAAAADVPQQPPPPQYYGEEEGYAVQPPPAAYGYPPAPAYRYYYAPPVVLAPPPYYTWRGYYRPRYGYPAYGARRFAPPYVGRGYGAYGRYYR